MEELKKQVRDVSEKATSLTKKTESLIGVFPFKLRTGFKERILELYKTENIEFSYRPPFQDISWKVTFCIAVGSSILIRLRLVKEVDGKLSTDTPIILSSHLYQTLANERNWRELLDFISGALYEVENKFTKVYETWIKEIDPDIVKMARALRASEQKVAELWKKSGKIKKEVEDLKIKNRALCAVIDRSIELLEKSTKVLESTKTFLGKSKTIKGVRNRIEAVIEDLKTTLRLTT